MQFTEHVKGVYQLNPGLGCLKEPPIVLVHPFYFDLWNVYIDGKPANNYRIFSGFHRETSLIDKLLRRAGKETSISVLENHSGDYKKNIESLVSAYQGPVIALDTPKRMHCLTLPYFEGLSEKRGRYFVYTEESSLGEGYPETPIPSRMKNPVWENFAGFVRQFGRNVGLAGGQLFRLNSKKQYLGCLSLVYQELKKTGLNPKFIEGCCFE